MCLILLVDRQGLSNRHLIDAGASSSVKTMTHTRATFNNALVALCRSYYG